MGIKCVNNCMPVLRDTSREP